MIYCPINLLSSARSHPSPQEKAPTREGLIYLDNCHAAQWIVGQACFRPPELSLNKDCACMCAPFLVCTCSVLWFPSSCEPLLENRSSCRREYNIAFVNCYPNIDLYNSNIPAGHNLQISKLQMLHHELWASFLKRYVVYGAILMNMFQQKKNRFDQNSSFIMF